MTHDRTHDGNTALSTTTGVGAARARANGTARGARARARASCALVSCATALAALAAGQGTSLVSISASGDPSNGTSDAGAPSADGRWVTFASFATNLVAGSVETEQSIWIQDRYSRRVELASRSLSGAPADGASFFPSLAGDGRYVCFLSHAGNLVAGDTNGAVDAFVRDRLAGVTTRVSVGAAGAQANGATHSLGMSSDGAVIAFAGEASNLVAADTNDASDVFVHDRASGITARASIGSGGEQANGPSFLARLSGDGRCVAFLSHATNLVTDDTNGVTDLFVHDRATGVTRRVSVDSAGQQANAETLSHAISHDGRYVAFASLASNLVANDLNAGADIFVHDLQLGLTTLVSVSSSGAQANWLCGGPTISADGRWVSFHSWADNLAPGTTTQHADVFLHDRSTGATTLLSASVLGGPSDGPSYFPALSEDGAVVVFLSGASNLVAGDTNEEPDVFAHDRLLRCFVDADGDGFGDAETALVSAGPSCDAGFADNGRDCDDTNSSVRPGAFEFCDGLDNDCDGDVDGPDELLAAYCTAGVSQQGCTATVHATGAASANAASGFVIEMRGAPAQRSALLFYGLAPAFDSWAFGSTSFLCVGAPRQRTGAQLTSGPGAPCAGALQLDWNAWRATHPQALGAPFAAGQVLYAQGWYRDPGAAGATNLSDGLRFTLCD